MDEEQAFRAHLEAFNSGDFNRAAELFAPQCRWHIPALGITAEGRDKVREVFQFLTESMPDVSFSIVAVTHAGGTVTAEGFLTGTHQASLPGPLSGVEPAGLRVDIPMNEVVLIQDGLIINRTTVLDETLMARLLAPPRFEAFEGVSKPFSLLDRHAVVVGQSGSGKSNFIGRMLEELAGRTRARLVVLDRAGDFIRMDLSVDGSTLDLNPTVYSNWPLTPIEAGTESPRKLGMHLSRFSPHDLCSILSVPLDPIYWTWVGQVQRRIQLKIQELLSVKAGHNADATYDFVSFAHACAAMREEEKSAVPEEILNVGAINSITEGLLTFSRQESELHLRRGKWDSFKKLHRKLPDDTISCVCSGSGLQIVDLSSLRHEHARYAMVLGVLRGLWSISRDQWWKYNSSRSLEDSFKRIPTFVVIDEAHHLIPSDIPESQIATRVRDALLEIATEGRKLGLWLICGTQRPTKLHPTILSESSNFLLMRTLSPGDTSYLSELLGRPEIGENLRSLERHRGQGFLAGEWADNGYEYVIAKKRQTYHPPGTFAANEWIGGEGE